MQFFIIKLVDIVIKTINVIINPRTNCTMNKELFKKTCLKWFITNILNVVFDFFF